MTESIKFLVKPNSSKNSIAGIFGDMIKVKICAAPDKGKANKELLEYLSSMLKIPKIDIDIICGRFSNIKEIKIKNISREYIFSELIKQ
ncbi:MAG: DUF167 domain-containing protein [Actinomycetota bacterium]